MFKLVNLVSNIATICDEIIIGGFSYYVSDGLIEHDDYYISFDSGKYVIYCLVTTPNGDNPRKLIATNCYYHEGLIPQVVDIANNIGWDIIDNASNLKSDRDKSVGVTSFIEGWHKAKETYQFTEEDMINFSEWYGAVLFTKDRKWAVETPSKEILEFWKERQPKTIYYGH